MRSEVDDEPDPNEADQQSAWRKGGSPLDDPGERDVFFAALDSFRQYRPIAHKNITHRRRQNLYALPSEYWKLLATPPFSLLDHLSAVDDAIDVNADLADAIEALGAESFGLPQDAVSSDSRLNRHNKAKFNDHTKAHQTLRQLYRDWTSEGYAAEIEPAINIFLDDLRSYLSNESNSTDAAILLPGAGLGRLLLSLCLAGYNCTGNEISWHMLLASNFMLNATTSAGSHRIYPFVSTFTNNLSTDAQLRSYPIPDIHPAAAANAVLAQGKRFGEMSMTAADFITSYNGTDQKDTFDAVITHYFIDTAPNLFRYIETVLNCLKPQGLWLNIGPLFWHFDDRAPNEAGDDVSSTARRTTANEDSTMISSTDDNNNAADSSTTTLKQDTGINEPGAFSLPHELVLELIKRSGFEVLKEEILPESMGGYITDPESMLQTRYRNAHWVARKL